MLSVEAVLLNNDQFVTLFYFKISIILIMHHTTACLVVSTFFLEIFSSTVRNMFLKSTIICKFSHSI